MQQPTKFLRSLTAIQHSPFLLELAQYAIKVFPLLNRMGAPISAIQLDDLIYLATVRKSGLCASRAYGKTLLVVIYDSFMARKGYKVTHRAQRIHNLEQFYDGFSRLGWKVTLWHVSYGDIRINIGLYVHGRGPRCDVLSSDEVGTVILPRDKKFFRACQEMLAGSPLGKAVYIGTQDPNSIWSEFAPTARIRGYDPKNPRLMPWVTMAYNYAVIHNPAWYVDQEYHCIATPAGGRVLKDINKIDCTLFTADAYAIDTNPAKGYYVVGSHSEPRVITITDAEVFQTLKGLDDYIKARPGKAFYLELNGPGGVVRQHLIEAGCPFTGINVTDAYKNDRVCACATKRIDVPAVFADEVIPILQKQIWDEGRKKIVKFNDAHYFDAFYLSVIGDACVDAINPAEENTEENGDYQYNQQRW